MRIPDLEREIEKIAEDSRRERIWTYALSRESAYGVAVFDLCSNPIVKELGENDDMCS